MSDANINTLITTIGGVILALIGLYTARQATKGKEASREAASGTKENAVAIQGVQESANKAAVISEVAATKADVAATKVEQVHVLVNGQREALQQRIAELEVENRKLRGN